MSKNHDDLQAMRNETRSRLQSMRPWYSPLTRFSLALALPVSLYLLSISLNVASLVQRATGSGQQRSEPVLTESEAFVAAVVVGGVLMAIGWLLDRGKSYLFPKVFFAMGRQREEFLGRQRLARLTLVTVGLGLIVSIAGSVVSRCF